jgi:hypothetical protein
MTSLPSLSDYQRAIILLLYRFRFLNRHHIQRFLHHKHHSRIQHWLSDLAAKKYVHSRYSRAFGSNTIPSVYFLATKSKYVLADIDGVNKTFLKQIYKEQYKSQTHVSHCLTIADIYFYLETIAEEGNTVQLFTRQDVRDLRYFPRPSPDGYCVMKGETVSRYFIELIDPGTPRYALRKRISQYIGYLDDRVWQNANAEPVPSVLFVCPDESVLSFLSGYLKDTLEEEGIDVPFLLVSKSAVITMDPDWTKIQT